MRFVRVQRLTGLTWGVMLTVIVWAGLVGLHELLVTSRAPDDQTACLVRAVTGVPCPTCGSTRSVLAVAQGDVAGAFMANPLVFTGGIVLLILATLQVGFARRVELRMSTGVRRVVWTVAVLLFIGNWAYVIGRDWPDQPMHQSTIGEVDSATFDRG